LNNKFEKNRKETPTFAWTTEDNHANPYLPIDVLNRRTPVTSEMPTSSGSYTTPGSLVRSGGKAPLILQFCIMWKRVVSFTLLSLYPRVKPREGMQEASWASEPATQEGVGSDAEG
jgi:hypothetical protein